MAETLFKRWDIVVLPYPLSGPDGGIGARRRPALIVSSDSLARDYGLYWVVMITAQAGKDAGTLQPADVALDDWMDAGLPVASLVRTTKLMTVQARQIIRGLGTLSTADQSRVIMEISRFMG